MTSWWREPSRDQWAAFAAAWSGWVLDAFDFTIFLLVMPAIAREFGVTYTSTALSITLTLLMRLLGGMAAGALADRYGRRLPLMLSIVWFAVCDGLVALAPSFTAVLVLRTLFGFGMGAEWTAGATLAMERWPQRTRGLMSGILQGSWAIGFLLAGWVTAWVVPTYGWRAMFAIAALPALLVLPIRAFVREAPLPARAAQTSFLTVWSTPALRRGVLWSAAVLALGFAGYYAASGLYATFLLTERGFDAGGVARAVSLFNLGMMGGAIASGALASRIGPRWAIGLFAALAVPALPLFVSTDHRALMAGGLLVGLFAAGHSGVTPYLLHALFPAEVRGRCIGLAYHLGAFASAFVPLWVAAYAERTDATFATSIALTIAVSEVLVVAALLLRPRGLLTSG